MSLSTLSNGAAGLDASWSARWVSLGPSSYCCRSSEADVGRSRTVQHRFSRRSGKFLLQQALLKPAHPAAVAESLAA